jgi:hypothetical protein
MIVIGLSPYGDLLLLQTYGYFFLPPASQTYVNVILPESDHLSFFCPREVLPNLSRPFCSLSLALHESAIPESLVKSIFDIDKRVNQHHPNVEYVKM